jgi:hypothetical protein
VRDSDQDRPSFAPRPAVDRALEGGGAGHGLPGLSPQGAHGEGCSCVRCAGFARGNGAAVKHGARAELLLAPLREAHALALRRDYASLDERRLAILADRLARMDNARAWLDAQGTVVRDELGRVFDVVDRLESWGRRAEAILAELEAESREAESAGGLERLAAEGRRVRELREAEA